MQVDCLVLYCGNTNIYIMSEEKSLIQDLPTVKADAKGRFLVRLFIDNEEFANVIMQVHRIEYGAFDGPKKPFKYKVIFLSETITAIPVK